MKKKLSVILISIILSIILSGCFTSDPNSDEEKIVFGTMAGAVIGGIAGNYLLPSQPLISTSIGFMLGGGAGYMAANKLTKYDRLYMKDAAYKSLSKAKIGEQTSWYNQQSGNAGTITPVKAYHDINGRLCREFKISLTANKKTQNSKDRACKTPKGDWIVI